VQRLKIYVFGVSLVINICFSDEIYEDARAQEIKRAEKSRALAKKADFKAYRRQVPLLQQALQEFGDTCQHSA
jgi:hypothetical protein